MTGFDANKVDSFSNCPGSKKDEVHEEASPGMSISMVVKGKKQQ